MLKAQDRREIKNLNRCLSEEVAFLVGKGIKAEVENFVPVIVIETGSIKAANRIVELLNGAFKKYGLAEINLADNMLRSGLSVKCEITEVQPASGEKGHSYRVSARPSSQVRVDLTFVKVGREIDVTAVINDNISEIKRMIEEGEKGCEKQEPVSASVGRVDSYANPRSNAWVHNR